MTTEDRARLQTLIEKFRDEAKHDDRYTLCADQLADELLALLLAEDGPYPE